MDTGLSSVEAVGKTPTSRRLMTMPSGVDSTVTVLLASSLSSACLSSETRSVAGASVLRSLTEGVGEGPPESLMGGVEEETSKTPSCLKAVSMACDILPAF